MSSAPSSESAIPPRAVLILDGLTSYLRARASLKPDDPIEGSGNFYEELCSLNMTTEKLLELLDNWSPECHILSQEMKNVLEQNRLEVTRRQTSAESQGDDQVANDSKDMEAKPELEAVAEDEQQGEDATGQ